MIIGHGDIASALKDRDDLLFFASGVSYSGETKRSEYQREINLLLSQPEKHIVYFSSLCVFYSDTPYAQYKRHMERLVKGFTNWTIIRLGNITWGNNTDTLINHFREQKHRGEKLEIQNVYRYMVNKEEFLHWIDLIPPWNCEMNITGRRMTVREIVDEYV